MKTATALITAAALVLGVLPATASAQVIPNAVSTSDHDAKPDVVQFVDRGGYTDEDGREIQFAVWRDADELEADVSIFDPVTGDSLELWLEDGEVKFEGMLGGEAFRGSAPFTDFIDADTSEPICVGWVALVCAGVLVILATSGSGGCAAGEGCKPKPESEVPGGAGGVPTPLPPGLPPGGSGGSGGSGSGGSSGGGGDGE